MVTAGRCGPENRAPRYSRPSLPPGCNAPSQTATAAKAGDTDCPGRAPSPPSLAGPGSPGGPVRNTCRAMCFGGRAAVKSGSEWAVRLRPLRRRSRPCRPGNYSTVAAHALPTCAPPHTHIAHARISLPWGSVVVAVCKVWRQVPRVPCAPV